MPDIDPMYRFGLGSFMRLFGEALAGADVATGRVHPLTQRALALVALIRAGVL
jgi:hypothetical protein